jgi:hypothetical protein
MAKLTGNAQRLTGRSSVQQTNTWNRGYVHTRGEKKVADILRLCLSVTKTWTFLLAGANGADMFVDDHQLHYASSGLHVPQKELEPPSLLVPSTSISCYQCPHLYNFGTLSFPPVCRFPYTPLVCMNDGSMQVYTPAKPHTILGAFSTFSKCAAFGGLQVSALEAER